MPCANTVYSSIAPPRRGLMSAEKTPEWIQSSSAPSASRSSVSTASPSPRRSSASASARLRQIAVRRCGRDNPPKTPLRSGEHTPELQAQSNLVCRLLPEKKKNNCDRYRSQEQLLCPSRNGPGDHI